jgi:predicted amidohydrolase
MLFARKKGLTFALIETRFESFEQLSAEVMNALETVQRQPLLIVFPEAALGEKTVKREQTKKWIASLMPLLRRHGNAHLFLSVWEKNPAGIITNSGYLVEPSGKYQVYPKYAMRIEDENILRKNSAAPNTYVRWRSREMRNMEHNIEAGSLGYSYPQVVIRDAKGRNQTVELRICMDLKMPGKSPAHVVVVPAMGLGINFPLIGGDALLARALQKNGYALVHDIHRDNRVESNRVTMQQPPFYSVRRVHGIRRTSHSRR